MDDAYSKWSLTNDQCNNLIVEDWVKSEEQRTTSPKPLEDAFRIPSKRRDVIIESKTTDRWK